MSGKENYNKLTQDLLRFSVGPSALFAPPSELRSAQDMPRLSQMQTRLTGGGRHQIRQKQARNRIQAHGTGTSRSQATLPALAELLERYCAGVFTENELLLSMASDLGAECLDLDTLPRVSEMEAAHPKCSLTAPRKDAPIRWVKGVSLTTKRELWLPAVTVFSDWQSLATEKFWFPISTGCAAHTDMEEALLRALLEVIERDAIALTWLQRMSLPELELDVVPTELQALWTLCKQATCAVDFRFFDATRELGLPVVYGLRIASCSEHAHTLVGCSAGVTITQAIGKVFRDLVGLGAAFNRPRKLPESLDDFNHIFHGAAYMAHRDRSAAFDFLLHTPNRRRLSDTFSYRIPTLSEIVSELSQRGMEVYAADLTTEEAGMVGVKVVRVLVPAMQPLSFVYRAQYKGHPRLYRGPFDAGYAASNEDHLNPLPQPFA